MDANSKNATRTAAKIGETRFGRAETAEWSGETIRADWEGGEGLGAGANR